MQQMQLGDRMTETEKLVNETSKWRFNNLGHLTIYTEILKNQLFILGEIARLRLIEESKNPPKHTNTVGL